MSQGTKIWEDGAQAGGEKEMPRGLGNGPLSVQGVGNVGHKLGNPKQAHHQPFVPSQPSNHMRTLAV